MQSGARPSRALGSLVALGVFALAWWVLGGLRFAGRAVIARPWETFAAVPRELPTLGADVGASCVRAGLGLVAGVAIGIVVGLVAAFAARKAPVLEGLLDFARSIPPVVLLPMFLLAFGYDDSARVATVAAGCVWTMALAVTAAAAAPRSSRSEMLLLAGASKLRALSWTQPWESLAALVVGLRSSASTAVIVAVVTEMVAGAEHGVGARVISAQIASDTVGLTLNVLAIGLAGYLINLGLRLLERWSRRYDSNEADERADVRPRRSR